MDGHLRFWLELLRFEFHCKWGEGKVFGFSIVPLDLSFTVGPTRLRRSSAYSINLECLVCSPGYYATQS